MPKIQEIQVERVDLNLLRPYTIAFRTVSRVENAIVRVILDNGVVGLGAGNPSPKVVGEDLNQVMAVLNQAIEEEVSEHWEGIIGRKIDDLETICQEIQQHLKQSPTARGALEIALFDSMAQSQNQPLAKILGQKIQSMPTSITIGIKGVEDTLEEADEYYDRGFRYLKIKLGNHLEEDIERVIKLREKFRDKIKIRVDANQGYTVEELIRFHRQTHSSDVEFIEQPLPTGQEEQMRTLPKDIKYNLAADESLINPADAASLARDDPACGIFNIKLMKCGGITQAKSISAIAELADIELMWGCNDESIISITAALHTAFSCKNTRYIDLDGSLDLAEDVVTGGFILKNGEMSINHLPGLGLTVN